MTSIWDYLGFLFDEQRVADGRAMMRQYEQILRAAERRFGVDHHVVAAVWGVETDYRREGGSLSLAFGKDLDLSYAGCHFEQRVTGCPLRPSIR